MPGSVNRPAAEAHEAEDAPLADLGELVALGDTEAILALARAYRAGSDGATRDLKKCYACYEAAARLGSAEAEYSLALFHLSGGVVPQDLKRGAAYLRTAAENGSLHAKVYLANLYELGIEYAASQEKADVWYRSAARAAGIDDDPASDMYELQMADLGCARYCLALADGATTDEERERWLGKARAYGYGLKLRQERASRAPPDVADPVEAPAPEPAPAGAPPTANAADAPKPAPKKVKEMVITATKRSPSPAARVHLRPEGLTAFVYATFFAALALGAGVLGAAGVRELAARGQHMPFLDGEPERAYLVAFVVFAVLPAFLMYRAGTVLRAVLVAALGAGLGHVLWGFPRGMLLAAHLTQSVAFAAGAFLLALLVLGFAGGAKPRRRTS